MKNRRGIVVLVPLLVAALSGCTVFVESTHPGTLTAEAWERKVTQMPLSAILPTELVPTPGDAAAVSSTADASPTAVPTLTLTESPAPSATPEPAFTHTAMPSATPSPAPTAEPELSPTESGSVGGEFGPIVYALDDAPSSELYPSGVVFAAGTKVVRANWRYRNMVDGAPYKAMWYREGTLIEEVEGNWDVSTLRDEGWARILSLEHPTGLENGRYRLELYLGDQLAQEAEFYVGDSAGTPAEATISGSEVAPSAARSGGTIDVSQAGESGMERVVRVVSAGADGVNLRSGPSSDSEVVATMHQGEVIHAILPGKTGSWWPTYDGRGRIGWIQETSPIDGHRIEVELRVLESELRPGDMAEVICISQEDGRGCTSVHGTPGLSDKTEADVLDELGSGSMVEILGGPEMRDDLTWWWVLELGTGLRGWVSEVTSTGYRTLFSVQ